MCECVHTCNDTVEMSFRETDLQIKYNVWDKFLNNLWCVTGKNIEHMKLAMN